MGIKTNSKYNSSLENPGPGAYEPKETNRPNPKSFKISSRSSSTIVKGNVNNPGPGEYNPAIVKHNLPKWTMGSKSQKNGLFGRLEKIHADNPAPGIYNVNKSFNDGPKVK